MKWSIKIIIIIIVCFQSMVLEEFPVAMDRIAGVNCTIHQQIYSLEMKMTLI